MCLCVFVGLTCVKMHVLVLMYVCAYFGLPVITCISVCILSSSADCKHVCVCVCVHRSRWRINSVKYDLQEPNMLACLCLWK